MKISRVEENNILVGMMTEITSGKIDEVSDFDRIAWHLQMIDFFVADISKSLAIIADKLEGVSE